MDPLVCDSFGISSKVLGEDREIYVYLPSGIVGSGAKYPVIYLLDGHSLHNVVSSFVQYYSSRGRIPHMIVVGIASINRVRDFTPTVRVSKEGSSEGGGAEKFLSFLINELFPIIERKFPINEERTLIGHSMGGLFVIYTLLTKPDLFRAYVTCSPWLLTEDEPLISKVEALLKKGLPSSEMLYIAHEPIDSNGIEKRIQKIVEVLKKNPREDFVWQYKRYDDADHSSLPLKAIPDALDFFYKIKL
jgi:predicted alpha/beta superfamily hydrolase